MEKAGEESCIYGLRISILAAFSLQRPCWCCVWYGEWRNLPEQHFYWEEASWEGPGLHMTQHFCQRGCLCPGREWLEGDTKRSKVLRASCWCSWLKSVGPATSSLDHLRPCRTWGTQPLSLERASMWKTGRGCPQAPPVGHIPWPFLINSLGS